VYFDVTVNYRSDNLHSLNTGEKCGNTSRSSKHLFPPTKFQDVTLLFLRPENLELSNTSVIKTTLEKACVSIMGEVLYSILIRFCIPVNLVSQIKMCLNET